MFVIRYIHISLDPRSLNKYTALANNTLVLGSGSGIFVLFMSHSVNKQLLKGVSDDVCLYKLLIFFIKLHELG
jgi:4-diphosphocytidyl-2C-methyl-D-erythritol kinase